MTNQKYIQEMNKLAAANSILFKQTHAESWFDHPEWGKCVVDTSEPKQMLADLKDWIDANDLPLLKRGKKK